MCLDPPPLLQAPLVGPRLLPLQAEARHHLARPPQGSGQYHMLSSPLGAAAGRRHRKRRPGQKRPGRIPEPYAGAHRQGDKAPAQARGQLLVTGGQLVSFW